MRNLVFFGFSVKLCNAMLLTIQFNILRDKVHEPQSGLQGYLRQHVPTSLTLSQKLPKFQYSPSLKCPIPIASWFELNYIICVCHKLLCSVLEKGISEGHVILSAGRTQVRW